MNGILEERCGCNEGGSQLLLWCVNAHGFGAFKGLFSVFTPVLLHVYCNLKGTFIFCFNYY